MGCLRSQRNTRILFWLRVYEFKVAGSEALAGRFYAVLVMLLL